MEVTMDNKIDAFLSSKYTSLFCALVNGFFAISSVMHGSIAWFLICSIFCALCFRNYVRA
jgi:hypothetical protein